MSDPNGCKCGHKKAHHIYETGACRPGFACSAACSEYTVQVGPRPTVANVSNTPTTETKLSAERLAEEYVKHSLGHTSTFTRFRVQRAFIEGFSARQSELDAARDTAIEECAVKLDDGAGWAYGNKLRALKGQTKP